MKILEIHQCNVGKSRFWKFKEGLKGWDTTCCLVVIEKNSHCGPDLAHCEHCPEWKA